MGGKRQGMTIFAGSLKQHWIRYVTELDLKVNPADPHAVSMMGFMVRNMTSLKSIYVQPGFVFNAELEESETMKYNTPSVMHMKFVNGQERKYHMGLQPFSLIMHELNHINNAIEFERSLAGIDDELEDDAFH